MSIKLDTIHYYPVKGLTAQTLDHVTLTPGGCLPHDRRFAILHRATQFDPLEPAWKPKTNFLVLLRDEKLATLQAVFDPATCMLVLNRNGKRVAGGRIDTATGRLLIDQFLSAYMKDAAVPGPYKIVESPGHNFTDIPDKAVSLLNLASVKDIGRVTQRPVDPLRFRANLHLAGLEPWAEMAWVDKRIAIGDTVLSVFKTTTRCAAVEVNPATGERDMALLKALKGGFDHVVCGVYARVEQGGEIKPGDAVQVLD
jgi:uncharacterized protein YcbX